MCDYQTDVTLESICTEQPHLNISYIVLQKMCCQKYTDNYFNLNIKHLIKPVLLSNYPVLQFIFHLKYYFPGVRSVECW